MKALALVIGINDYLNTACLKNCVNDASDLAGKLESLGFFVNKSINEDEYTIKQKINAFGVELDNYDIGLFYFAGHGVQVNGRNYLLAKNSLVDNECALMYSSVELYLIIDYMERAKNNTNIIILDACREDPFGSMYRGLRNPGLATVYAPKGTLISFSTSPGQRAKDGKLRNGAYTSALLKHIDEKDIPIETLFKRVRNTLYAFTNGEQISWEHTSLTGDFIINSDELIHSVKHAYSTEVLADKKYKAVAGSLIDGIISDLKSYTFYTQAPAINRISSLDPAKEDKHKLFILGRNILQTATGGEFKAKAFLKNAEKNLEKFSIGGHNPVLDGILYETFFNSDGRYREVKAKSSFLDDIWGLRNNPLFEKSFEYIIDELTPFRKRLLFWFSKSSNTVSIDVVLEKRSYNLPIREGVKEITELYITSIKYQSEELLIDNQTNVIFLETPDTFHYSMKFMEVKQKISEELIVPQSLLIVNTNLLITDKDSVQYPFGVHLIYNFNK